MQVLKACVLFVLVTFVAGQATGPFTANNGGTWYNADGHGHCSFDPSPEDPLLVAAIASPQYDQHLYCGACAHVTGPSGSVTVRIVDECPDSTCLDHHLDFSQDAFERMAPLSTGRIDITWEIVDCPSSLLPFNGGNLQYKLQGSNQWYVKLQVRNHRVMITNIEIRVTGQSSWVSGTETPDNFYEFSTNLGSSGTFDVRTTAYTGEQIIETAVLGMSDMPNGLGNGAQQFGSSAGPKCSSHTCPTGWRDDPTSADEDCTGGTCSNTQCCHRNRCNNPPTSPANGAVTFSNQDRHNSVASFSCDSGFTLVNGGSVTCSCASENANWPSSSASCQAAGGATCSSFSCSNGWRADSARTGTTCTGDCSNSQCCIRNTCTNPPAAPANGGVGFSNGDYHGSVASFSCGLGFALVGDASVSCSAATANQPWPTASVTCSSTCADGVQNNGEAGVDCGGACTPCATCDDGVANNGETGVDCGGPCPDCPCTPRTCASLGLDCGTISDGCGGTVDCGTCTTGVCGGAGTSNLCGSDGGDGCQTDASPLTVVFSVQLSIPPEDFQSSSFIADVATVLDIPSEALGSIDLLLDQSTSTYTRLQFSITNVLLEDGCNRVDVVDAAFRLRALAAGEGTAEELATFESTSLASMVVVSENAGSGETSTTGEDATVAGGNLVVPALVVVATSVAVTAF